MNRYIEIVFDNSGSMSIKLNNKTRMDCAKELFEYEILPNILQPGDKVALRLLRDSCSGTSHAQVLPKDESQILQKINNIFPGGDTPLYYTIKDSVEACKSESAHEKIIFVLTDGGDSCQVNMETVINSEDRYLIKEWNVLLMQFAINDPGVQNNLTAFSNYIGAKTFTVGNNSRTSFSAMRADLHEALVTGGFSNEIILKPCFEELPGKSVSWLELESQGFILYQATLLFEEGFLSWKPKRNEPVYPIQFAELKFIYGLRIKTSLPKEIVAAMLSQLHKPYYYSMDCIYWDFTAAKWKYQVKPNEIKVIETNPDEERIENSNLEYIIEDAEYDEGIIYVVTENEPTKDTFAKAAPKFSIDAISDDTKGRIIKLKPGQKVSFEGKNDK